MKERFEHRQALVAALQTQQLVQGDLGLAEQLADVGELVEFHGGQEVTVQEASDRDAYFLLSGTVRIIINGVRHHTRSAGVTVGEMSAINPTIPRSATLVAEGVTVVFKVNCDKFAEALDNHPAAWRRLAVELASRIEQRNQYVQPANRRPRVFIISSLEGKEIADEIRLGLEHDDMVVDQWSDNDMFPPGAYALDVLEQQVAHADFGIAIASPDDLVRARDREQRAPRDNVVFELGFFVSRLGRDRVFLLTPPGDAIKIPTDYKGITPITYENAADDTTLSSALAPTIGRIQKQIKALKIRSSYQPVR
jgi:CRP/FNR family cyclic AMP-dependent transcriptional regulator